MEELTRRPPPAWQALVEELKQAPTGERRRRDLFLERVLTIGTETLGAIGAAAWLTAGESLELAARLRFQEGEQFDSDDKRGRHLRFLVAAAAGQSRWLGPHERLPESSEENPAEYPLLLLPLVVAGRQAGVLEFFFRDDDVGDTRRQRLSAAGPLRGLSEEFLLRHLLAETASEARGQADLAEFALRAHSSLETPRAALILADDVRTLSGSDRVTIAACRHGACRIIAVSGQETFSARSGTVRTLQKVAALAAKTGRPIECDESVGDVAPQLQAVLYDYLEETHARQLAVVPLIRKRLEDSEQPEEIVGVMTAEQLTQAVDFKEWRARLQRVMPHVAMALGNALESDWPLLPAVGRAVHRSRWRRALRNTRLWAIAGALLAAMILILTFYPADFALSAPGQLQPVTRREVFAQVDGTVQQVHVRHGQAVRRGQLLAELVNHDLNVAEAELAKELQETTQELANCDRELNAARNLDAVERGRLTARRATAAQRLRGLQAQQAFYAEKRRRLRVESPIDGQIVTWNVAETLLMRPVRPGEILLTVVDSSGDWELEVRLPERRLGHIAEARRLLQPDLGVTYVTASDPYSKYQARLEDVRLTADVEDAEEGNVVMLKAKPEGKRMDAPVPGGEVRAKVHCGRRALGYVLFHDIYEFYKTQIAFRF